MVLMSFTIAALLMSVAAALCHLHMHYTLPCVPQPVCMGQILAARELL